MLIVMDDVFRLSFTQTSKFPNTRRLRFGRNKDLNHRKFHDPYQLHLWAERFNMSSNDLLASFSFYLLRVLRLRVQHSIQTQSISGISMKSLYDALSIKYKKKRIENKNKFWIDTGCLMDSITVWRDSNGKTNFGIPRNLMHESGDVEMYKIFHWLEFGTKKNGKQIIPPRPLITPHWRFIMKNIPAFWNQFLKLVTTRKINLRAYAGKQVAPYTNILKPHANAKTSIK